MSFDKPIDPASVVANTVRLFPSAFPQVTGTLSQSTDGLTVFFVPDQVLPVSVFHSLQVSGLTDVSGNECRMVDHLKPSQSGRRARGVSLRFPRYPFTRG